MNIKVIKLIFLSSVLQVAALVQGLSLFVDHWKLKLTILAFEVGVIHAKVHGMILLPGVMEVFEELAIIGHINANGMGHAANELCRWLIDIYIFQLTIYQFDRFKTVSIVDKMIYNSYKILQFESCLQIDLQTMSDNHPTMPLHIC